MSIGTGDLVDDAMAAGKLSLDSVYTVWSEHTAYNSDILFKRNAISFDPSINLSNNAGKSSSPRIAASGNNVYVVWSDDTPGNTEILYRRSTDGGASFGGTVNLSNTTGSSYPVNLGVSGNDVYVVWSDETPGTGNSEILYRKSGDGGASFGGTVNLSNTTGISSRATVAVSNVSQQEEVYVLWIDDDSDILYRKSTDGGASFGRTVRLTSVQGANATVAVSGNNVYLVWNNDAPGSSEIFYRKSTDGGAFFGDTVNLSNTAENSYDPHVAVANNLSL
jgi:ethanolamine utilization microcompartment shell protein EutL